MTPDQLLDLLTDAIAERMARRSVPSTTDTYTSVALPPDCPSRERFNRLVRKVPGAEKRGHIWTVPAKEWLAFRATKTEVATAESVSDRILTQYYKDRAKR